MGGLVVVVLSEMVRNELDRGLQRIQLELQVPELVDRYAALCDGLQREFVTVFNTVLNRLQEACTVPRRLTPGGVVDGHRQTTDADVNHFRLHADGLDLSRTVALVLVFLNLDNEEVGTAAFATHRNVVLSFENTDTLSYVAMRPVPRFGSGSLNDGKEISFEN
jgi:hypothetical protein